MNLLQQIEENRRAQNKKLLLETLNDSPDVTIEQVIEQLADVEDMRNAFMALTIGEIQGLIATAKGSPKINGSTKSRAAAKQERDAIDAAVEAAEEEVEEEVEEDEEEEEVKAAPKSKKKTSKKKTNKKTASGKKKAPKKVAPPKKASTKKTRSNGLNLRTPEGREEYDQQVVGALVDFGEPALATDIREKVGGTPAQLRASLNRLIELGQAGYEGATRSTRYFLNA